MIDDVRNEYFEWLYDTVCEKRYSNRFRFRKLFMHLHRTKFTYSIKRDQNRAEDGKSLRYRFGEYFDDPCSVLEMIIALAIRCEEDIMDDSGIGDRTGQWFWGMIHNLGLGSMTDERYDREVVDDAIERLLNRDYEPDGRGGLFTVKGTEADLRNIEIWIQMLWYLDSIS